MIELIIKKNDENQTIIRFLKKIIDYKDQNVNLYKLLRTKKIKINNVVIKDSKIKLFEGDVINIYYNLNLKKQRDKIISTLKLPKIAYEDENILIVIKDFNLLVHNSHGDSLDNQVKNFLINKNEYNPIESQSFMVSHVNRIDKLTKGLVIYSKNKKTLDYFLQKINKHEYIEKFYLLKCEGLIKFNDKEISGYIFKNEISKKMIFNTKNSHKYSQTSKTLLKVILKNIKDNYSILEAKLITGRKNQIRSTMEFLKHPIENDYKYGAKKISNNKWINLFAYKIRFVNLDNDFDYLNNLIVEIPVKFN